MLTACAGVETPIPEKLTLAPTIFGDLPGWQMDRQSEALPAFARSCAVLAKKPRDKDLGAAGKAGDWQEACTARAEVPLHNDAAARAYFERYFTPYAAAGNVDETGLFTGYYEAGLHGSLRKTKRYNVPLYARPRDLIDVDLGLFKPEWKGKHVAGKVDHAKLIPYDDRAAIEKHSLKKRARVLLWVDDPIDAFFLAIQGSGRVRLPGGHYVRVGYDGANGRAYVAIGRPLAEMGALAKPVTMPAIRAWLKENPDRADEVMNLNPSYVFFRRIKGEGPIGAQGVVLTPRRSLAVDPAFVPFGTPLWLDALDGTGASLRHLVIAQDTGGAIKGPVRGDFFWGAGDEAALQAGSMQSRGRYYLLLPKSVRANAGE
jgi:membrane-bound lytic murein transglycosylase A